jgi:hypothetical protein
MGISTIPGPRRERRTGQAGKGWRASCMIPPEKNQADRHGASFEDASSIRLG